MPQFKQVDVFTTEKYRGNPVAVFFDAGHLSSAEMSRMSAWTNLSEATFVLPPTKPGADYRVRIFTLKDELPFAGHPTIGTCFALLEAGLIKPKNGKIIQECAAGLVELDITETSPPSIRFKLPYEHRRELSKTDIAKVAGALGVDSVIDAAVYDVGPIWLTVLLETAQDVLQLKPDMGHVSKVSEELDVSGFQVIGKYEDRKYETRTFNPREGVDEDPVCGSGSGATAAFLRDSQGVTGVSKLSQGTVLDRAGKITIDGGPEVFVGGNAVTVINGEY